MPLEEHREQVPVLTFPRQTIVSLLVFAVCWQALSYLSPYLGIPPFAVPSLVRIAQRIVVITPLDVVVTLARVIGALVASFVLGLAAAMAMYRSKVLDDYLHPMIRILMAVPVVSWIQLTKQKNPNNKNHNNNKQENKSKPENHNDTLD